MRSDRTAPAPEITSTQTGTTGTSPINFKINFTEPVDGFESSEISLSGDGAAGATVAAFTPSGDGSYYTFDVAPTANGPVTVDVAANVALDEAKNPNNAAVQYSVEYDDRMPTTRITSTQTSPTNAPAINFQVTFGEPVTGFAADDIELTGEAAPSAVTGFAADGDDYTFDVVPTRDGLIHVDIAAGVAQNNLGSDNIAAPTFSIRSDRTAPVPVINSTLTGTTNATTIDFKVDFGENVTALIGMISRFQHRLRR